MTQKNQNAWLIFSHASYNIDSKNEHFIGRTWQARTADQRIKSPVPHQVRGTVTPSDYLIGGSENEHFAEVQTGSTT